LLLLAAGVPVLESLLVLAVGEHSALALAPQATAVPPIDVFHDLRWLLVAHESRAGFAVELLALFAARTALTAALVRWAWPSVTAPPSWSWVVRRAGASTAVLFVLMLPLAVVSFAMAVVSLSWLFFVTVPVLVMIGALTSHAAVDPGWVRRLPPRAAVSTTVLAVFGATLAGAAAVTLPPGCAPFVAALAGVGNAWCWARLVSVCARDVGPARVAAPAARRRLPVVLVGLVTMATVVLGGAGAGFAVAVAVESARRPLAPVAADADGSPVLVVKGFNSQWDGIDRRWVDGEHRIWRFSYRGTDPSGVRLPYGRSATHRSLRALVATMADQVDALAVSAGAPVSVVAESEGSLLARAYLASHSHAPVTRLVSLSPLVEPGRVYYPKVGDDGWGAVSALLLDGASAIVGTLGPVDVGADLPLFRSIVDLAPAVRGLLGCALPGVRELVVEPLDSGLAAPAPSRIAAAHVTRPAFHGGLLGDRATSRAVTAFLRGERVPTGSPWSFVGDVVQAGASAWQAPTLPVSANRGWRRVAVAARTCRDARATLARELGGIAPGRAVAQPASL
jgi:hypothetical protein